MLLALSHVSLTYSIDGCPLDLEVYKQRFISRFVLQDPAELCSQPRNTVPWNWKRATSALWSTLALRALRLAKRIPVHAVPVPTMPSGVPNVCFPATSCVCVFVCVCTS